MTGVQTCALPISESGFKAEEKKLREIATTATCSTPKNTTATLRAEEIKALMSKISGKENARSGSAAAIETISVLRSFVIGYEGGQPDEVEPADDPPVELDSFHQLKKFFDMSEAFADGIFSVGSGCLFGGWQSVWVSKANGAGVTCQKPNAALKGCSGTNMFQCNPILFGPGVCVSSLDKNFSQFTTARCNGMRKASDVDIAKYAASHLPELSNLLTSVNSLCSSMDYLKHNADLCDTVISRLNQIASDTGGANPISVSEAAFDKFLAAQKLKPDQFDEAKKDAEKKATLFEGVCMTKDGAGYHSGTVNVTDDSGQAMQVNCPEMKKGLENDLKKIQDAALENSEENRTEHTACAPPQNPVVQLNQKTEINTALWNLNCDAETKSKQNSCGKDFNCAVIASMPSMGPQTLAILNRLPSSYSPVGKNCHAENDNCIVQAVSGLLKGLWNTIVPLLKAVVYGGGALLTEGVNWLLGTEFENEATRKVHKLSEATGKMLEGFKKDWFGFIVDSAKGIVNGVQDWVKADLFCMKWSGVPRMSECVKPLPSWGCMDCKTAINGVCTGIETAVSFYLQSITGAHIMGKIAGGVGGVSAAVTARMIAAARSGSLGTVEKAILSKFPNLPRNIGKVAGAVVYVPKKVIQATVSTVKAPFKAAWGAFKWLGGKTAGQLLTKLKSLKAVNVTKELYAKIPSVSKVYQSAFDKSYQRGYNRGMSLLRRNSPAVAVENAAINSNAVAIRNNSNGGPGRSAAGDGVFSGDPDAESVAGKVVMDENQAPNARRIQLKKDRLNTVIEQVNDGEKFVSDLGGPAF